MQIEKELIYGHVHVPKVSRKNGIPPIYNLTVI